MNFVVTVTQFVDISDLKTLRVRKDLHVSYDTSRRHGVQQVWKLCEMPDVVFLSKTGIGENWIIDPWAYDPAVSSNEIYYRLGRIPLQDHLNHLTRKKSPSWQDQELRQIDEYNFSLGIWRWKYDTPHNKLLMCLEGPAEGNWTDTLI